MTEHETLEKVGKVLEALAASHGICIAAVVGVAVLQEMLASVPVFNDLSPQC
jgi:hypothetical protein